MTPPKNVEVHDNLSSVWWIEEDGLLCSVSKQNAPQPTREQSLEQINEFNRITGGRKLPVLMDVTHSRGTGGNREDREFIALEIAKIVRAMAIISNSALGKMVVNLFFNLKPPPYPAKMFTNEQDAREWLSQFIENEKNEITETGFNR